MFNSGISEYLFTAGILLSFVGIVAGGLLDRRNIADALRRRGLTGRSLLAVILIIVAFAAFEIGAVKPTQLLFFDDAIYQNMAQMLLHTGQAWMCNYGIPTHCYVGEIFHEPIGLSFNLAMGFAVMGTSLVAAHLVQLALACAAILLAFLVSLLMFEDPTAAYFTGLLMALSPIVIVWALPTNSDMALLAYSLLAFFFTLVFARGKRNVYSFSNMLLSISLLMYMRVMAALYIPILALAFLVLQGKGIRTSFMEALGSLKKNLLNTKALIVLLLFVITVTPSISYAYLEFRTGNYGYYGTQIENTCNNNMQVSVTHSLGLGNFRANVCGNVMFWFNKYKDDYIMQPIAFTLLAIAGAILMLKRRRMELLVVGIWFLVFFVLYAMFYAGSVAYGVDWRFMLSLIAQACLFGGYAVAYAVNNGAHAVRGKGSRKLRGRREAMAKLGFAVIASAALVYPAYTLLPSFTLNPSQVLQAGGARFYESFVYDNIGSIPTNCLVFSYDPTLFLLNNRSSTQMSDLLNVSFYQRLRSENKCMVFDYGYWCYTPDNICGMLNKQYNLTPLLNASYDKFRNYGFYYVKGLNGTG